MNNKLKIGIVIGIITIIIIVGSLIFDYSKRFITLFPEYRVPGCDYDCTYVYGYDIGGSSITCSKEGVFIWGKVKQIGDCCCETTVEGINKTNVKK